MKHEQSVKKNAILSIIKQLLKVAFPLITFPYVSRVLLEDNLGKYNFTLALISYFSVFAGLGINSYAIREGARIREDKNRLTGFASEIFTINLITTIATYCLLGIVYMAYPKLAAYKSLIIVQSSTILAGTLGVDWINSIFEDFEYITKRFIIVKVVALCAIFLFVKKEEDYVIYALINSGAEVLASIMNIVYCRRYVRVRLTKSFKFSTHIKPMLVLFANSLAISLYMNSDIVMLGMLKSDADVGIYSVSSKMYQIAKNLVNAITIVTIPRLSAYLGTNSDEKFKILVQKTIKTLVFLMFPIIVGMFMLSKEIVFVLGGDNFLVGSNCVRILSIALIPVCFGNVFFDGVLIVKRKEKICFMITFISALINVALNLYMIPTFGIEGAAITTLIAELTSCILAVMFSRSLIQKCFKCDKDMISVCVGLISIIITCILLKNIIDGYSYIILCILISFILYGAIVLLFRNTIAVSLIDMIKKFFVKLK